MHESGGMYTVRVQAQFNSAHNLRKYSGKCEDLHGHNWRVELSVRGGKLDDAGMVEDFKELKNVLNDVVSGLDHKHLNTIEYFKKVNPTSENIARYIYEEISRERPELDIAEVTVWETDTSSAAYSA